MIQEFPRAWYDNIVTGKFRLRSDSLFSNRPWGGGQTVTAPHSKLWLADISFGPLRDALLQDFKAFFSALGGRSGLIRISDASRYMPWADRSRTPTTARFSDGTLFTDNTGFVNGYLPPEVFVDTAASAGSDYIVLRGFPASTANVLRSGDLLEIKPNGVAATFPHLYETKIPASSDSSGRVGIQLTWQLRAGVAAGDTVSLRFPSTLFHMTANEQFEFEDSGAGVCNGAGGSLVEAVELVP